MSEVRYSVLFCDELEREESGQLTLTGLYAPLMLVQSSEPVHVTTVAFVRGPLGSDLSDSELSVCYSVDGGREVRHNFPPMPNIEPVESAEKAKKRAKAAQEGLELDQGQIVGALRIDGIEFEKHCVFTAELNGERIWKSVFLRDEHPLPKKKRIKKAVGKHEAKQPLATSKAKKKS